MVTIVGALQDLLQLGLLGVARRHFLLGEIGVVGEHGHAECAFADLGDTRADIAETDDADGLAEQLGADIAEALDIALLPHGTVGLHDLLGDGEHEAHGVLGNGLLVGAGLVADEDPSLGAGIDVDHVVAGAKGADGEQVRRLGDEPGVGKPGLAHLGAGAGVVAVRAPHLAPGVGGRPVEIAAEHVDVGAPAPDRRRRRIEAGMEVDDLLDVGRHAAFAE